MISYEGLKMKEITKLVIKIINKFLLDIVPYAAMIAMAIGIHIIADHPDTIYIIIVSVIMLITRFIYHLYEIGKLIEGYKKRNVNQ